MSFLSRFSHCLAQRTTEFIRISKLCFQLTDLGSQTFCLSRHVENIDTRGMELPPFCLHIYFHLHFFIIPSLFFFICRVRVHISI